MGTLTVGVVLPRTGRLRRLADPVSFVLSTLGDKLRIGGRAVEFAVEDSRSEPAGARVAVHRLVHRDRASVVLALGGTHVVPAVAATCEELRVPCVSTTLPWQVYRAGRAVDSPAWSYHFGWGLGDIGTVFAEMWTAMCGPTTVGCLWNGGVQGTALRDPVNGFLPAATRWGHHLVDPGAYEELADDFERHVSCFLAEDVKVVTSAATSADLAAFSAVARRRGLRPRLVTCSRWLSYPFGAERAGLSGTGTIVAWTPQHPHRSSLDGMPAADLAAAYEDQTGRPWLQPLGLAHGLVEVAVHALTRADDPGNRHAVAEVLRRTRIDTICGRLDWTSGPAPTIAPIPLVGGRWVRRGREMELRVEAAAHWEVSRQNASPHPEQRGPGRRE